ncbi:putative transmembrane sensor domain protein [Calothrix sp. NIES-4071]|nr:putative transmembrane sensor domain protein [Calothrix sp. NIES-4071]BAZ54805.1 putative transmembrane sensor domain protein [Calothrix sp. NIES-4105]
MWKRLKIRFLRSLAIETTAVFVTLGVITLQLTGTLQFIECAMLDQWFRVRPEEAMDSRIVIVTIDENDISRFRSWPIYDTILAKLLNKIKQQQPAVIGLDLYRNLPVEPGHKELLNVYQSTPNLIGIKKVLSNANGPVVEPPPVLGARSQVAACDLVLENDGKVRRYLLSVRVKDKNKTYLTLGAKSALHYLDKQNIKLISDGHSSILKLGKAKFVPLQDSEGGFVRADVGGYQILANFRSARQRVIKVPLLDVLENRVPSDLMTGKVVFVGSVAESLSENFYTPYTRSVNTSWSGVELHADLTSQILSAALDGRQLLRGVPESLGWLWILFWSSVGATIGWEVKLKFFSKLNKLKFSKFKLYEVRQERNSMLVAIGILLPLAIVSLFASTYVLFMYGWWVNVISPLLGLICATSGSKVYLLLRSLHLSHKALANYAQTLELTVKERTQELIEKNIALEAAKQEAELANKAKSIFLANISHELRTPLNAILGFSQILTRDQLTLDQKQHIEIINRSGKHLLELINDVLSMSKIEAGSSTLIKRAFDLYALLDAIYKMLQLRANNKQLKLKFELIGDIPQYIITDESKLRQILLNLLGNAIKFTSYGSITLQVKLQTLEIPSLIKEKLKPPQEKYNSRTSSLSLLQETVKRYFLEKHPILSVSLQKKLFTIPRYHKLFKRKDKYNSTAPEYSYNDKENQDTYLNFDFNNNQRLVFEVIDTGYGISPQDLEKLFSPFFQTQLGRQYMEGTGLGLAISQEYVKLMGGDIIVSSVEGKGSTFRFDIKFDYTTDASLEKVPTQQVTGLVKNQPRYRILIAEDVEESRLLLVKLLEGVGFDIQQAINGKEAVQIWESWRPHLIFMDMRMPVMDGYEATRRIREIEEIEDKSYHTIIIALTASTFEEQQQQFFQVGCNAFVGKPVCEALLYEQIAKYLNVKYISISSNEQKQEKKFPETSLELSSELLMSMPSEWIDKLHYAAISLNDQSIIELIKDIPDSQTHLAQTLTNLVDNFRLDIIAQSITRI